MAIILTLFIGVSTISLVPQLVSGFSWPCIDRTDGKAPMVANENIYDVTFPIVKKMIESFQIAAT